MGRNESFFGAGDEGMKPRAIKKLSLIYCNNDCKRFFTVSQVLFTSTVHHDTTSYVPHLKKEDAISILVHIITYCLTNPDESSWYSHQGFQFPAK